jgi:hypothetical protein
MVANSCANWANWSSVVGVSLVFMVALSASWLGRGVAPISIKPLIGVFV